MTDVRPIETVFEDGALMLRWLPGRARRLVVVFTGAQEGFGGQPLDEFAGSASDKGDNKVLFVTDRLASWYAAPGLWQRIVHLIKGLCRDEGVEEVVTLGNSMGGYGAILLPRDVPVRRAIAFSPQLTVDPKLSGDTRWPDIPARWGDTPAHNLAETIAGTRTQYYLTAGAACPEDVAHLNLAPDLKRVHRWILPRGRHNLAAALKSAGLLHDVIHAILRGRKTRVDNLYDRYAAGLA